MSPLLIARSPDLQRLRDDGYSVRTAGGHLVIGDVPWVDHEGVVHHDGALAMALTTAGSKAAQPGDHTAWFIGGVPCDVTGTKLSKIINNEQSKDLGDGLIASCFFSAAPTDNTSHRYDDFWHKVTTYIGHISGPAAAVESTATARRYKPVPAETDDDYPFKYLDTASSRAGITAVNERLSNEIVGIVGLGGTGVYIFDHVAKTKAPAIHIFDGDRLHTHNAFRAPGAVSLAELETEPMKVDYYAGIYGEMRHGITAHPYRIDEANVSELLEMTFVFVAIDDAAAKAPIITALIDAGIPFIDVGMGINTVGDKLGGLVRTTLVSPDKNDHANRRISTTAVDDGEVYRSNIQTSDLNALNAAFAVHRWKQFRGVYADDADGAHNSIISVSSMKVVNEETTTVDLAAAEEESAA